MRSGRSKWHAGVRPGRLEPAASSLSGFCTRACFPRIAPATWANGVPLETVVNRSVPMACGPNVDQAYGIEPLTLSTGRWWWRVGCWPAARARTQADSSCQAPLYACYTIRIAGNCRGVYRWLITPKGSAARSVGGVARRRPDLVREAAGKPSLPPPLSTSLSRAPIRVRQTIVTCAGRGGGGGVE
jgi:hypothetical protein